MKRMMVQLTEEQLKALKELAKARHVSVAKVIRESVAIYVATTSKEPTMEEKRRRALAALDLIEKAGFHDREGKTDVSINHDKYFAESIL